MNKQEQQFIDLCMQQIASHFVPSKAKQDLKQRDLQYIAQQIEDKSKIRISLSTLKRLLKNNFQKSPHPATLNALAVALDYQDWQAFTRAQSTQEMQSYWLSDQKHQSLGKSAILGVLAMSILLLIFWSFTNRSANNLDTSNIYIDDEIEFSVKQTVDLGVPNSVIFTYDLKDSRADSFFIQRSWNPANKAPIDPLGHHFAEVYYSPGFHWAKLIANEQQIAVERVHVKTKGWFASVKYHRQDRKPIYLDQDDLVQNGALEISADNFIESGLDMEKEYYLRYYNIREFDGLSSHNFRLQTRFKCTPPGQNICPYASLMLVTERNVSFVDLSSKGCVANIELMFGDTTINGKDHDLSELGTDILQWQDFEWITKDKKVQLRLNGQEVLSTHFVEDYGDIVGLIYTFSGSGSVDYIRMSDHNGEKVYQEEF